MPRFRAAVDGLLPVTAALEARAVMAGLQRAAKGTAEAISARASSAARRSPTTNKGAAATNKGAAVRYSAEVTFKKLTIKVVAEPGGKGLVTAHPIGFQDPADLYDFIQLDTSSGESEE